MLFFKFLTDSLKFLNCPSVLVQIFLLNTASTLISSLRFCSGSFLGKVLLLRFSNIWFTFFSWWLLFRIFFTLWFDNRTLCLLLSSCCQIICYCFVWGYINCEVFINCRSVFIVTNATLVIIFCYSFYTFKAWWQIW